jgi:GTP cyclohydrolase IA
MMDITITENHLRAALTEGLGFDLSDPNLTETPKRIAKMYCNELFKNVDKEYNDFKSFPNTHGYDQIIVSDRISFVSVCAHHFLPFTGLAWLLYIPDKVLIGASKMARLVDHYSKRPQIQENLCHEILHRFDSELKPLGCMVFMKGIHDCMRCRGAKQPNAGMITSAVKGAFTDSSLESKGLEIIKISLNSLGAGL